MTIFVTGGAGFIGSALIRLLLSTTNHIVVNIDKLTYAGNLDSIPNDLIKQNYFFENVDIADEEKIDQIFKKYDPNIVFHLAAESHVDKSLTSPDDFIQTNIYGTYSLLKVAYRYWRSIRSTKKTFLFHHVSTDEVFGDLENTDDPFNENSQYKPSSPYSASKASSDHLVKAWGRSFGLPYVMTNCSNNYGPYQFPEKLIPHVITSAINGKPLPIYGNGLQIRDWLYVNDHAKALYSVATNAKPFSHYNIGGWNEMKNIDVVNIICNELDNLVTSKPDNINSFKELITYVDDRPGHDRRYAIDASKIYKEINWKPDEDFNSGISKTIKWYLKNTKWTERVFSGDYKLVRQGLEDE